MGGGGGRRERDAEGTRKGVTAAVSVAGAAGHEDGGRERIRRGILDEGRRRRDEDGRRQRRKCAGSGLPATGMKTHMSGEANNKDVKEGEGEGKIVS